jgi:primosomal protein N' (replication factor Y)
MGATAVAKIALEAATYAIDKPYDYLVEPDLADRIAPGMRVVVPFGPGNRRSEGLILALKQESSVGKLKSVLYPLDEEPVLDGQGLRLALWMREQYFCTVYEAARSMLPAGLWYSLRDVVSLAEGVDNETAYGAAAPSDRARRLLDLLYASGGSAEMKKIKAAFEKKDPNPAMRRLMPAGILNRHTGAPRQVGDKSEQRVTLLAPAEDALAQAAPKRKTAPVQYSVLELLCAAGSASSKELCYFTGATPGTLRSLAKRGLVSLTKQEVFRRAPASGVKQAEPVCLSEEQQEAYEGLDELCRAGKPAAALLYGVTGSGKTQVYLKLIKSTLDRGRSAMVLVPEIALTPQLLALFEAQFGEQVAVLHSSLGTGERYDEWKRARGGKARVVIGTRSAVFAPLVNLGLVILDEEQESTYKSEQTPRYHAREVAKYRCFQNSALLVLGSATPSVETMYFADQGIYHRFSLKKRYNEKSLPSVLIADMKQELRQGNGTSISGLLRHELEENLTRGQQSILFLNRRGASRLVSCGECGAVPVCPRCSVHLTYHSANGRLMCHYCGHSQKLPEHCPECGGAFNFIGTGTQRVQKSSRRCFPDTEILRMDADTVTAKNSHEAILSRFQKKKVPILLGTQMVAKGLDFENVTLVGVIAADLSLYVDDFRASERTFSLLTQVVGRAGRGDKSGRAVIQTWTPQSDVICLAADQDYDRFYEQELTMRRLRACPPFSDLIFLTAVGPDEEEAMRTCLDMRQMLELWTAGPPYNGLKLQILGPAPAAVARVNNRYRYRLTLTGRNSRLLRNLVAHLLRTVQTNRRYKGISVFADINPLD